MTPDQLRELADRVSYAATFLMRPGMPSIYWNACNRAADYLRLQAHTHPAPAAPQADAQPAYRLAETDIYDFAGWLTCRNGVMPVGSTSDAAPMAEAVGDYIRTFPERFAAAPAAPQAEPKREPLDDHEISKLAWQQNLWTDGLIEFSFLAFARAVERAHGISGGGHD